MGKTAMRENTVVAIQTRKGLYVVAQALKHRTMMFFNIFTTDPNTVSCDLETAEKLCVVTPIRSFFDHSEMVKLNIKPASDIDGYRYRNHLAFQLTGSYGFKKIIVYKGTKDELTVPTYTGEFRLVDSKLQTLQLLDKIQDLDIILSHQLDTMGSYEELNERLYLSHLYGRYVEPDRDLQLGITPITYKVYFQIMAEQISEMEWSELPI